MNGKLKLSLIDETYKINTNLTNLASFLAVRNQPAGLELEGTPHPDASEDQAALTPSFNFFGIPFVLQFRSKHWDSSRL